MGKRPYKEHVALAREYIADRSDITEFDLFVFTVYEHLLNDEENVALRRDVNRRNTDLCARLIDAVYGAAFTKEYEVAAAALDDEQKAYWEKPEVSREAMRKFDGAYYKIAGSIWQALKDQGYSISEINAYYDTNRGTISRQISEFVAGRRMLEATEQAPRPPGQSTPEPLDFGSEPAQSYYDADALGYYQRALKRYRESDQHFDFRNPIIRSMVHELIMNDYEIAMMREELRRRRASPHTRKNIDNLLNTNVAIARKLIELQEKMGELKRGDESLAAIKRRLEEVRADRDEDLEAHDEETMAELEVANNSYMQ